MCADADRVCQDSYACTQPLTIQAALDFTRRLSQIRADTDSPLIGAMRLFVHIFVCCLVLMRFIFLSLLGFLSAVNSIVSGQALGTSATNGISGAEPAAADALAAIVECAAPERLTAQEVVDLAEVAQLYMANVVLEALPAYIDPLFRARGTLALDEVCHERVPACAGFLSTCRAGSCSG